MSGGTSFGGDNINHGNQALGDGDVVADGGVKGDGNTVTNTINKDGGVPTWDDVTEEIGDDEAGKAHVMGMQAATESEELTDQQVDIIKDGLAWMKIQSPNALRVAAEVIKKGPAGGTAKVMEMIADYVEQ